MNVKKKKIRFIPRTAEPDNPVDRMRCFNVIQGLEGKGYDVGLYHPGEHIDALVTLSLDFAKWSEFYGQCFHSNVPVILDLAENEFERSAKLTRNKMLNFISDLYDARRIVGKIQGFFKRREFDQGFYPFVKNCTAVVGCSRIIVRDAKPFVKCSYFIPDAIDQDNYQARKEYIQKDKYTIGWVGVPSALHFLLPLNKTLQRLQEKYDIHIVIITSADYERISHSAVRQFGFRLEFVKWTLESIARSLTSCDIGIAPLPHDSYKSSNKVGTYWAVGLPVVASPTYEYSRVIVHGENGFIAKSKKQWEYFLERLILNVELQRKLGLAGLQTATKYYTIEKVTKQWERVLSEVLREY
ncbi:glycosyltransferase family 4 protein [Acidobacteria bacterium AH-259-L09]|nr:glycosyltransferase family 4 protein [Acidobacteria bacterium AH-259-L09]